MAKNENRVFISGNLSTFEEIGVPQENMGYAYCGNGKREAGAWFVADENVCDFIRKTQQKEKKYYQRHGYEGENEIFPANELNKQTFSNPESELIKQEQLEVLYKVLDKLTELDREIIELSYYMDMTDAAIGKVIGMSQRGVNKRRNKTLGTLKNILEKIL